MPGRVHVSPSGRVCGWAFRNWRPGGGAEVEVRVDGERVARLSTGQPSADAAAANARAANAGFAYVLAEGAEPGRVREVRVRLAGGAELEGSPAVWEPRRPNAPARSFLLERDVRAAASRNVVPLQGGGCLRFDRHGMARAFAGRRDQLVQNRPEVGGLPGHRRYRTWPAYLLTLPDHLVDPAFGGVYRPAGALWQGASYLSNSVAQRVARHQARTGALAPAPAKRCFLLCNSVKDTFYHWHLDGLAGMVMARELAGATFRTLAPPSLNAWQSASLELLGEDAALMPAACRPEETLVASHIDGRGIHPDRWVLKLFHDLKRAHRRRRPRRLRQGLGRRVFVSRRDAAHRVLENEGELWAALEPLGFTRFTPGEASYADQIDIFSEAEVVVASHGSALTNIGHCRPGTRVVEIMPAEYVNGCFRYLAIAFGLRHAWYTSDQVDPFGVDVDGFMAWAHGHDLFGKRP